MSFGRVLIVGELNPHGADPRYALYHQPRNASGNRLRLIMGLSDLHYARMLDKTNLCTGKWSMKVARARASDLLGDRSIGVYVLLGRRVALAFQGQTFGGEPIKPFDSYEVPEGVQCGPMHVISLPHPSGRCRAWNEPGACDKARELLRYAAPHIPWGSWGSHPLRFDDARPRGST